MEKKLNRIIVSALISAAVMIAAHTVHAHVNEAAAAGVNEQAEAMEQHQGKKHRHGHHFAGPHKDAYLLLLAEKFTPNDLEDWQAVIKEHRELKVQWKEKVKQMNEAEREKMMKAMKKHWKKHGKAFKAVYQSFSQAVDAWLDTGDTAGMSKLMPELLKQMKEHNKQMQKKL